MTLPPSEVARLDSYARTMRTALAALFFVAMMGNLIPRHPDAVPMEVVNVEVSP